MEKDKYMVICRITGAWETDIVMSMHKSLQDAQMAQEAASRVNYGGQIVVEEVRS